MNKKQSIFNIYTQSFLPRLFHRLYAHALFSLCSILIHNFSSILAPFFTLLSWSFVYSAFSFILIFALFFSFDSILLRWFLPFQSTNMNDVTKEIEKKERWTEREAAKRAHSTSQRKRNYIIFDLNFSHWRCFFFFFIILLVMMMMMMADFFCCLFYLAVVVVVCERG